MLTAMLRLPVRAFVSAFEEAGMLKMEKRGSSDWLAFILKRFR